MRFTSFAVVAAALFLLTPAGGTHAQQPPPGTPDLSEASEWPLDRITLKDGTKYAGLIERRRPGSIQLLQVVRRAGQEMFFVRRRLATGDIARRSELDEATRKSTRAKVEAYLNRDENEAKRMESLELERSENGVWQYEGRWFDLDSTAGEEVTRRSIVRMEQIFGAYRKLLPPKTSAERPLRILLLGSTAQYREFVKRNGLNIENPAFFSADSNVVVAASDLTALGEELEAIRKKHDEQREIIDDLEEKFDKRIREAAKRLSDRGVSSRDIRKITTRNKAKLKTEVTRLERQLAAYDRKNESVFDDVTRHMFETLFHESFHAYLENYVYNYEDHDVPRWLNEGLAQIFQSGLLEAGELRVDAADEALLEELKTDLRGAEPLRLADVLAADYRSFLVAHGNDPRASQRHYLYAWGLSYYLTFEQGVLGTEALDRYVEPDEGDADPIMKFEKLVGTGLPTFEAKWREYMLGL